MPSKRNQQLLSVIQEKVNRAAGMFFVEYHGLTHQQLEEARRALLEADAEIAITKNTLMNIALQAQGIDAKAQLNGPQATLFSYSDATKVAKILKDFNKKYSLPIIKFGVISRGAGSSSAGEEWDIIDESTILALANLPTKEVLIAKLLGSLNSPVSGLVYVLNGNIQKLALVLKAIEKKKGTEVTN